MNDFLQSIRNGSYPKDNRPRYNQQKQRRNYDNNVNGNYRSNGNDKKNYRNHHKDHGASDETMKGILEALESISKNQESALEIAGRRAAAEERKATAIETIAAKLGSFDLNERDVFAPLETMMQTDKEMPRVETVTDKAKSSPAMSYEIIKNDTKGMNKDEILAMILSMRNDGSTYNEIANHLAELDLPTFSGRGKWHAQTIHRLCQNF